MKPGRKPIPRATRLLAGLPVCEVDECDHAPTRTGKCDKHRRENPRRRRIGAVTAHVQYVLPPDVVLGMQLEADRRNVYPSLVVEEALTAWLKAEAARRNANVSVPVRVVGPGSE